MPSPFAVTRRTLVKTSGVAALTALAAPALIGRAAAAAKTLVCSSLLAEDKPETKIWQQVRDLVEERLPGRFTFTIVPDSALGGEKETNEGLRLGSIQAGLSTFSVLSAWVPQTQLFDMPFLFRDAAHGERALNGAPGEVLKRKLKEQNFIVPAFISYGARHLLARQPLTTPQSLRGKRIRSLQSPLHVELWTSYGAVPVALPITETYDALATGVVDAMDLTIPAYAGFRLYEVVPKVILTGHIHAFGAVLFSAAFWNTLTAAEQDVLTAAAVDGAAYFNRLMAEDETASRTQAESGGAEFLAAEDRPAWEAGAKTIWTPFAAAINAGAALEEIRALEGL
ncbi:MAG: TRAP transporter substrate-binding protein [Methylobacteriaceae bacterium]|jgi:tripartite ATP-independent transporter DctP family solute receptor|nr:TRAP transporter substrate-binding protein [Methylobacteriaceae bacterium]